MRMVRGLRVGAVAMLLGTLLVGCEPSRAQAQPAKPQSAADDDVVQRNQEELIRLLRITPVLTSVVERDPSLLGNAEYVTHSNPELAKFLEAHPEIAKNPDFYLFNGVAGHGAQRVQVLEHKVWPENDGRQPEDQAYDVIKDGLFPMIMFLGFLGAVIWLTSVLLANRRWQKILKLQTDVHTKLIDRFGTSEELIQYMESESGRRFLEAAPIPVNIEGDQKVPSVVGRVLMPLQIGSVMSLLGAGLLVARHSFTYGLQSILLLAGIVLLMPGLGFLLSAGITWLLAGRLGLMPQDAGREGGSHAISDNRL